MNKNDIVTEVYYNQNIKKYCRCLTNDWEELISNLIIQLMNMNETKLFKAYNDKYLEYICMTICKRIFYGTVPGTGMFYRKDRTNNIIISDYVVEDIVEEEDTYYEGLDRIEEILTTLHWYDKILFNYYYKDGYKLREIEDLTSINLKSIHANIKKTKEYIKKKLKEDGLDNFN